MIQNIFKIEKIKLVNIVCCMTSFLFTSIFEESMRKYSKKLFLKWLSYGWEVDYFYDKAIETTYFFHILIYCF